MTVDAGGRLVRAISWPTAAAVVIGNMVGSGIFTTSGLLARDLGSAWSMLALWLVGGLIALAGALAYAELGAAMPEAGGEFVYLREAYGPVVAFLSGWTSLFVGFSGALAAALLGFAAYLSQVTDTFAGPLAAKTTALVTLWVLTGVHAAAADAGGSLQRALTAATVAAIIVLIAAGFAVGQGAVGNFDSSGPAAGNAAVSLIFVLYAYSGWNAAAYLAGEIREPGRGVPLALLSGTAVVIVLYLGLNVLYLYALSIPQMAGTIAIGEQAARALFGAVAARWVAAIIGLAILSSASAMVLAGPRVYYAMASARMLPRVFANVSPRRLTPTRAILLQSVWASVLILFFGSFEPIVVYTGFAVTAFAAAAVAAVVVLRTRRPDLPRPYRMTGYPWLALGYVVVSSWVVVYAVVSRPFETLAGACTVGTGIPIYYATKIWNQHRLGRRREE